METLHTSSPSSLAPILCLLGESTLSVLGTTRGNEGNVGNLLRLIQSFR